MRYFSYLKFSPFHCPYTSFASNPLSDKVANGHTTMRHYTGTGSTCMDLANGARVSESTVM